MAETVKIEGLAKLQRELKKVAEDLPKEVKLISKEAAEIVADAAKTFVPVLTGKLQKSIKPYANNKGGYVKTGKLIYAKPIHFGWAKHHIAPEPFMYEALDMRREQVIEKFNKEIRQLIERNFTPGTD